MRAAAFFLSFLLLGCATDRADSQPQQQAPATQQPAGDLAMRTLTSGQYAAADAQTRRALVARTADEYRRLWDETVGRGEPPQVDFATESVVILLAGMRPTGGFSVAPRGVRLDGRTLVVDAAINTPPPDAIVTQALTSPFAAIAVSAREFDEVRWTP